MVPCLHQGNVYIKRKLRVWKTQKYISLVVEETPLTCAAGKLPGLLGGGIGPRTETCINWGGPIAMVPSTHQGNICIQRTLRVWREEKCIPLVDGDTPLTCVGRKTTRLIGGQYRSQSINFRKLGLTYRHGTVFAPRKSLHQKEATCMESPEMYSTSWWRIPTYLCGPAKCPVS